MIRFQCSECQKAIGVDEKFVGRQIRCPGCQNPTRVPNASAEPVVAQAAQAAAEPTAAAPVLKSVHPTCPSCSSVLSNPSDAMCGICGHLLQQTSTPKASSGPMAPVSLATPGAVGALPDGIADPNLPVNPALNGNQYGRQAYNAASISTEPTRGKSIGAWVASVAAGMFLALIWGVIAAYTGVFGQVFAWAIGALVGLIAGLIGRNPSIPFCIATTIGAILCMLFGRLVSAWVIMITVSMMTSVQGGFSTYLIPETGVSIGVTEDLIAQGEFEGDEKLLAQMKIDAFFNNKTIYEMDGYDDIEYDVEVVVDSKVRSFVSGMSAQEKDAVLARVRQDHPEWMEREWHFTAIVDSMIANDEIEDEDLLAHAKSKLPTDDGSKEDYFQNTTQDELTERDTELRDLVLKRFAEMDQDDLKKAIEEARLNHPSWTPERSEYLAMLDAMYQSDDIPKEYRKIAKSTINRELDFEYDEDFENESFEAELERLEKEEALQAVVNKKLMELEQDEIDDLIASVNEKHPLWTPDADSAALEDLDLGFDQMIAGFESDGTFWGSLKTRFKVLDCVWMLLGLISAFAIVFTLGQSAKKS